MIDSLRRFLKVLLLSIAYVHELLGIAVYKREPGALYLHHDLVPLLEAVKYVVELKFHLGDLIGREGFWPLNSYYGTCRGTHRLALAFQIRQEVQRFSLC